MQRNLASLGFAASTGALRAPDPSEDGAVASGDRSGRPPSKLEGA